MLSLIQWEMWLGDQMLPIYPRLAGWFYFYACFKRHTILPLIRKLPIRKKNLDLFPACQEVTTETSMSQQQRIEGVGGCSISKMPLWEHKRLTLNTQRPNQKTGTVACAWGRSDRTIPKATDQPVQLNSSAPGSVTDPVSKNRVESDEKPNTGHACAHTSKHSHTDAYT